MAKAKAKVKSKKPVVVPAVVYTDQQIIDAIKATGGYLTHTAEYLQCPLVTLKKNIERSRRVKEALFEVKESCIELAESQLMGQIKKGNLLAIMFYLKCQAGWIDRPTAHPGDSKDKPLHIKIVGVDYEGKAKRGPGRPVKMKVKDIAIPASLDDDIIDGEVVNE